MTAIIMIIAVNDLMFAITDHPVTVTEAQSCIWTTIYSHIFFLLKQRKPNHREMVRLQVCVSRWAGLSKAVTEY